MSQKNNYNPKYFKETRYYCEYCRTFVYNNNVCRREHEATDRHKNAMKNFSKHKNQPKGPGTMNLSALKQLEAAAMESMSSDGPKKEFKVHSLDTERQYGVGPKMVSASEYDYGVVRNFYKTPEYRQYYQNIMALQQPQETPLESDPEYLAIKERLIKQKEEREKAEFEARQKAWEAEQAAKEPDSSQTNDYTAWKKSVAAKVAESPLLAPWTTVKPGEEVFAPVEVNPEDEDEDEDEVEENGDVKREQQPEEDEHSEHELIEKQSRYEKEEITSTNSENNGESVSFKRKKVDNSNKKSFRRKLDDE